jgi:hypothetical protein
MSILQAESMDEALVMVKDHHHLRWAEDCANSRSGRNDHP